MTTRCGAEQRQGTCSPRHSAGPSTGDSPIPDFEMGTRVGSDQPSSSANAAQLIAAIPEAIRARFWAHVTPPETGCWLWRGAPSSSGYGIVGKWRDRWSAHRASWVIHNGPIPAGLLVLHKCDVRLCVRPDHLYVGTQKDNVRDAFERGRFVLGEQRVQARLTEEQVRAIRSSTEPQRVLAARYGVHPSTISKARSGTRTWKQVA